MKEFERVFDAREGFVYNTKSDEHRLPASTVNVGDVVLVEAFLARSSGKPARQPEEVARIGNSGTDTGHAEIGDQAEDSTKGKTLKTVNFELLNVILLGDNPKKSKEWIDNCARCEKVSVLNEKIKVD